jgi:hypothetical protein
MKSIHAELPMLMKDNKDFSISVRNSLTSENKNRGSNCFFINTENKLKQQEVIGFDKTSSKFANQNGSSSPHQLSFESQKKAKRPKQVNFAITEHLKKKLQKVQNSSCLKNSSAMDFANNST